MRRDTIFRIASLTKPIAAAATMILVDDGVLRLDDAVDRWLPELANRRVLKRIDAQLDDTVPARRAITVRDLLTSCLGFGSVMAPPDSYPIQRPIRDGHLGGDGLPHPSQFPGPDEWMRRLGALPLMYQPGERWLYNTELRPAGRPGRARVRALVFDLSQRPPVRSARHEGHGLQRPRVRARPPGGLLRFNHGSGKLEVFDGTGEASEWSRPPAFESGAGGLASTADDYFAFCRMMLNGGRGGVGASARVVAGVRRSDDPRPADARAAARARRSSSAPTAAGASAWR